MSKTLFVSVFILSLVSLITHAADTNPPPRLTVELRDGSRVVGESVEQNFAFSSTLLGNIKLPVRAIQALECSSSNTIRLTTTNNDSLTVSMVSQNIPIKTSFGEIKLSPDALQRMKVSSSARGARGMGLVALWSGEGNANDTVGACHGRLMNGLGFAAGKCGQAFDFNSQSDPNVGANYFNPSSSGFKPAMRGARGFRNDYILIPACPALNAEASDGFSILAWINPANIQSSMLIAEFEKALGTYSGSDVGVQFAINNPTGSGCLLANIKDTSDLDHIFSSPPNVIKPGAWQHVALVYERHTGIAHLYVNGNVVAEKNLGEFTPQTSFPNLLLGGRTTFNSISNPSDTFVGKMDEIGFYNRALSTEDIRAEYDASNN